MQSYKERAAKNHQRSASYCNYDEFTRRRGANSGHYEPAEFRQRKPAAAQDPCQPVQCQNHPLADDYDEHSSETSPLNVNTFYPYDPTQPSTSSGIGQRPSNDVILPIRSPEHYTLTIVQSHTNPNQPSLPASSLSQIATVSHSHSASICDPCSIAGNAGAASAAAAASSSSAAAGGSVGATSASGSSPTQVAFKGHRRSLSLRQRFEVGVDYIVSELEHTREVAEKTVIHAKEIVWKVCHYSHLPAFMQDNEYLQSGHRPPLPTLWECAKSVFRVHTETGNIWTHLIGALLFLALMIYEFVTIGAHKDAADRLMLAIYFCGIILCLLFSTMFHTFSCYASPKVIKIFSKLDYCGISLQIIGSMIPALYYGFYNNFTMFKIYIGFGLALCILSIIVSMWDKFGEPAYRPFRAMVFLTFGLSNVIPGIHWYIDLDSRLSTPFGLFVFQGLLYVLGSLLYANRVPERFFPGKCDYIFQSHQIFHILVVVAALVHLNGINLMADFVIEQSRLQYGNHSSSLGTAFTTVSQ